jgi:hypothetical protein
MKENNYCTSINVRILFLLYVPWIGENVELNSSYSYKFRAVALCLKRFKLKFVDITETIHL